MGEWRSVRNGIFDKKKLEESTCGFEFKSNRLAIIRCKLGKGEIAIINVHAPTEGSPAIVKDNFYEEVELAIQSVKNCICKIIIGDFNAKVGRELYWRATIGKHSLHRVSNDNGERLIKLATGANLVVKSTMLPRKDDRKVTWISPDGVTENQIDHVLIDRKWCSTIRKVESQRKAEIGSDHVMVKTWIKMSLKVTPKLIKTKQTVKHEVKQLEQEKVRTDYESTVTNLFEKQEDEPNSKKDINEIWETMKQIISNAANTVIPSSSKNQDKPWFDKKNAGKHTRKQHEQRTGG